MTRVEVDSTSQLKGGIFYLCSHAFQRALRDKTSFASDGNRHATGSPQRIIGAGSNDYGGVNLGILHGADNLQYMIRGSGA